MAESGKQYRTLDERCRACEIQGGDEHPCLPPHYLAAEEEQTGFPCPRREWTAPGDPMVYELVVLGVSFERAHFFSEVFAASFGDEPREERQRLLRLILRAYGDEAIASVLWPKQE